MNTKRLLAIALAVGLPTVAIVATLLPLLQPGLPDPAGTALSQYLERHPGQVEAVTPASRPGAFRAEMSAASYSAGDYFRTTDRYGSAADTPASPPNAAGTPVSGSDGSLRALPYPVDDLWCALVTNAAERRVVYLALHQDLHRAEWVIHAAAGESQALSAQLAEVGCALTPGGQP